ncbi:MAG: hypothetical protein K2M55_07850 [Muribaculaceae bacterium]|nr:hypothetical protein [Muribaculaceae bacterium]
MKRIFSYIILSGAALASAAAPIDDVRRLYNEGDYAGAAEQARTIIRRTPRDGNANYYLGASLLALGDYEAATSPLKEAQTRGVTDASRLLAQAAMDQYDINAADEYMDKWEAALKKAKKSKTEAYDEMSRSITRMRNMLDRVERIEILDSLSVDSATFFTAYRLSTAAGKILPPDAVRRVGAGAPGQTLSTAYMPQNRSELLWAATDTTGTFELFGADILDDGSLDHTEALGSDLGDGGNAIFPFLMPDGVTLYFAADGDGSLGGYDIFMTRRNETDGSFFQPQNIGMPYNSPANDYMLAIDEASGLGWWATDRNSEPGRVTVYVFAPSDVRVNADTSDPNLASLARLDNIALTRKAGVDYRALLADRLPAADSDNSQENSARFAIDMGGRVYTTLSDFHNQRARSAMLEALATEVTLRKHLEAEAALRERYRKGDRSTSDAILASEAETARLRRLLAEQRNTAIRLER